MTERVVRSEDAPVSRRALLLGALAGCAAGGAAEPLPVRLDEAAWLDTQRARGILVGGKAVPPKFFVFFDPNCPYCARLWSTPLSTDLGGKMSNHPAVWVPVAYLKPSSYGRAVAILRGGDAVALSENFDGGFDERKEEGALAPLDPFLSERLILELNLKIWKGIAQASPLLVWRMRSAQLPARWMGLPSPQKLESFLRDVAV
jgi:thiol:disulfide interchange protein DsbG